MTTSWKYFRKRFSSLLLTALFFFVAAQADASSGRVIAWGDNTSGQTNVPSGLTNVTSIAAGANHSLALKTDGTVVAWGNNSWGKTNVPPTATGVTSIAAGYDHCLALKSDGTVVAWGYDEHGSTVVPAGLTNVTAIAAGWAHSLALKADGTVVGWGRNFFREIAIPAGLSNVVAIAADASHSLALKSDGTLVGWGDGANIPKGLRPVVAIAGSGQETLALQDDGTVVRLWTGASSNSAVVTNVVAICGAGDGSNPVYNYGMALKSDDRIVAWGRADFGQTNIPPAVTNVFGIAAGARHALAIVGDGAPFVSWRPLPAQAYSGTTVTLRAGATGKQPLACSWAMNGTHVASTTNAWLTLPNVQTSQSGNYELVLSNVLGTATIPNYSLTVVDSAPIAVTHPTNRLLAAGSNVTFSSTFVGSLPMTLQWQLDGTEIAGATASTLTLTNVQLTHEGNYTLVASNAFGLMTSSNAFLNVVDLSEALNTTNLTWSTAGDAGWFVQTNKTVDGYAAAQSGPLSYNQFSTLETTVQGPGTLTFWWTAYSDFGADHLKLSINGQEYKKIFGHLNWQQETVYLGDGTHSLQWFATNASGGFDGGWLDQVSYVPGGSSPVVSAGVASRVVPLGSNVTLSVSAAGTPSLSYQWQLNQTNIFGATGTSLALNNIQASDEGSYSVVVSNDYGTTNSPTGFVNVVDLAEALNASALNWTTGGTSPWYVQTANTHDGVAALQSGSITNNEQSFVETSVNGPGTLRYWWRVSSEPNDVLTFSLNDIEQARISGFPNWAQKTNYLGSGLHTLKWSYSKNASVRSGSDAAWLDEVSFQPGGTAPIILTNPVSRSVGVTDGVAFSVGAVGTPPLRYQWQFETNDIPGATNSTINLSNVQSVSGGNYRVIVSNDDGSVTSANARLSVLLIASWGAGKTNLNVSPHFGQGVVPAAATNVVAIAAGGHHSMALSAGGMVTAWGINGYSQTNVPASASNVVAIAAGNTHSVALRNSGIVLAWGRNTYSQTTIPFSAASSVSAIAAGWEHCLALKSNGTVVAWGAGTSIASVPQFGQSMVPGGLNSVTAIAAGAYHSLALKEDGKVVAWGLNASGQSTVPVNLTNVIVIAAGGSNSVALKRDGSVVAWGDNSFGQTNVPTGLTNVVAISVGEGHVLALSADGSLVGWGRNSVGQIDCPALTNIAAIAAGRFHSLALMTEGAGIDILSQPVGLTVVKGSNATLSVSASGVAPLSYQWQRNETNLVGATKASLIFTNAQFADEGSYRVIVSNLAHSVTSSSAVLRVVDLARALDATNLVWTTTGVPNAWVPQTLVSHDGSAAASSVFVMPGQTAGLQTTVAGPGTLTFWWMYSSPYSVPTTFNFSINGTSVAAYSGTTWKQTTVYLTGGANVLRWLLSENSFMGGNGYIDQVTYTPGTTGALIVSGPDSKTLPAGTNTTFSVSAGGTPPLRYQWQFNGSDLPGATNSSLSLVNIQAGNAGDYSVVVTNNFGVASASASLAVTPSAPSIWTQPTSQEMVRGGTVTFSPLARGSDPLTYQWYFNGTSIEGGTGSTLTLSEVQTNHVGVYSVSVSNTFGSVVSTNVTFTIVPVVIVGWGSVFTSSPNPPLGTTNVTAISGGDHYSLALRNDGTVFTWGWDAFSRMDVPPGLSNVTQISAGGFHGSALKSDGTVVNWGNPFFDDAAIVPVGLSNVVDIAAGDRFNLALKRDGTVTAWGENSSYPFLPPVGLTDVVDVAAGRRHSLALKSDGTVISWGGGSGATNVPAWLSNVVAIGGGTSHSIALRNDGTTAVWGNSPCTNIPGGLDAVVSIASGDQHCLALRSNGTVVVWGNNPSGQTSVPSWLTNVVAVAGGYHHSLALLNDGSPYVTRQPWSQTIRSGMSAQLQATVMGQPPLSYQWQLNGENISGATNSLLTISNAPLTASGNYQCVITNDIGSTTTLPATLTVSRSVPRFEPSSPAVDANGNLNLVISGLSGHGEVVLSSSIDLITWEPVYTNAPTVGTLFVTAPGPSQGSHRFYRVEER